jgi:hypothetical protein
MNKQLVQFNFQEMTAQQYGNVMDELQRDHPDVPGRIHHVSYMKGNDIQVIGVWESREKFENFYNQTLTPLFGRHGLRMVQPTILPVYNEYSGAEANVSH